MTRGYYWGIALGLPLLAATPANAVIIDTFNEGEQSIVVPDGGTSLGNNIAAAGIIGGSRTINVTSVVGGSGTSVNVDDSNSNLLSISNNFQTTSIIEVIWDSNGAGLGGANLLADGSDALELDIVDIDQGNVTLTFSVVDTDLDVGTLTLSNLVAGDYAFLFTDFINATNVNFGSVDSVSLLIESGSSSDFALDLVQSREGTDIPQDEIPAPAAFPLLGAGIAGLALARKYRKA